MTPGVRARLRGSPIPSGPDGGRLARSSDKSGHLGYDLRPQRAVKGPVSEQATHPREDESGTRITSVVHDLSGAWHERRPDLRQIAGDPRKGAANASDERPQGRVARDEIYPPLGIATSRRSSSTWRPRGQAHGRLDRRAGRDHEAWHWAERRRHLLAHAQRAARARARQIARERSDASSCSAVRTPRPTPSSSCRPAPPTSACRARATRRCR